MDIRVPFSNSMQLLVAAVPPHNTVLARHELGLLEQDVHILDGVAACCGEHPHHLPVVMGVDDLDVLPVGDLVAASLVVLGAEVVEEVEVFVLDASRDVLARVVPVLFRLLPAFRDLVLR